MGFFGLETVPRLGNGVASLRRMDEVERSLVCALVLVLARWTRLPESERQRIVDAIVVVGENEELRSSALAEHVVCIQA